MKKAKDAMHYEVAGDKKPSKGVGRKAIESEMDRLNSGAILWYLARKHKFGISVMTNMGLVATLVVQFLHQ